LIDRAGSRYLDLLSGWGVFGIGRNHPLLRDTLSQVLASDLPNLVQMDVSVLAGLLAETLLGFVPFLNKVSSRIPAPRPLNLRSNSPAARHGVPASSIAITPFMA